MTSTDPWVAYLESCVGIAEEPLGSNHTRLGVEYGMDRVAWCCITQSLATLHAFGFWVLHTAGVADAMARAARGENGMVLLGADAELQVGDLPCYDFGPIHGTRGDPQYFHIGGCVNPGTQTKYMNIEGNISDRCQAIWRDRKYLQAVIRLPFDRVGLGVGPVGSVGLITKPRTEEDMYELVVGDQDVHKNPSGPWYMTNLLPSGTWAVPGGDLGKEMLGEVVHDLVKSGATFAREAKGEYEDNGRIFGSQPLVRNQALVDLLAGKK